MKGSAKPVQKSTLSHFFGAKPPAVNASAEKVAEVVVLDSGPVICDAEKKRDVIELHESPVSPDAVPDPPVSAEEHAVNVPGTAEDAADPPTEETDAVGVDNSMEEAPVIEVAVEKKAEPVPEAPTGRRSSRIQTNADAYAAAYHAAQANKPPEPEKKSRKASTAELDDVEDQPRKSRESSGKSSAKPAPKTSGGSSSFFLSNKDKLALKEKERLEKIRLEEERLARIEAERQAQALREAQERDRRIQEQVARTREENNRMFCMNSGEDGVATKRQFVRTGDGSTEEVEVVITSNPFFNARVASSSGLTTAASVVNLEEEPADQAAEWQAYFPSIQNVGCDEILQGLRSAVEGSIGVSKRKTVIDLVSSDSLVSVVPSRTPLSSGLDLHYLRYSFPLSQDSRCPFNPQYATGAAPLNLRALWSMYFHHYCGKYPLVAPDLTPPSATPAKGSVASFFGATPKTIPSQASTNSLSAAAAGDSLKATNEGILVGNEAERQVLQSWLEEWAGKRRTPKKAKAKGKAAAGKGKRGRRDDDYSSEDDAWDSEGEGEGLRNLLFLVGPSGTNKTALVYHYARQLGYKVMEVNTSMTRSRTNIQRLFAEGVQSQVVDFGGPDDDDIRMPGQKPAGKSFLTNSGVKPKADAVAAKSALNLILFDEVDVVFEEEDTHFYSSIQSLAKVSKCPIVLTGETLCPALIKACRPRLLRLKKPEPAQLASKLAHIHSDLFTNTDLKAALSLLPALCDGDFRACQSTISSLFTSRAGKQKAALVVDLCASDSAVVDLTSSSPVSKQSEKAVKTITPLAGAVSLAEESKPDSSVEPPKFGSFVAESLRLDFAVFDNLHVSLGDSVGVTDLGQSEAPPEPITDKSYRLSQSGNSRSALVVVPVVSEVEPRSLLVSQNTLLKVHGKHFLQSVDGSRPMTVEVLVNGQPLKEMVLVSDTTIAAVIPARAFAAGVYTAVVRLSDLSVSSTLTVRSDVCGEAGGCFLIFDRTFKAVKPASTLVPKKKTPAKPAKTMALFDFAAPAAATAASQSGKRLSKTNLESQSPSKKRRTDEASDDASVETEATEDADSVGDDRAVDASVPAKLPVRRRLQVCDDEDDDDEVDRVVAEATKDTQSVQSAGLTESTEDEKVVASPAVVEAAAQALSSFMSDLMEHITGLALALDAGFVNATLSQGEHTPGVDLSTIQSTLSLYEKEVSFAGDSEDKFPDLDAFVADVRSVWTSRLSTFSAESREVVQACMLSEVFEGRLFQGLMDLAKDETHAFNAADEGKEAPLAVLNNDPEDSGSVSVSLYGVSVAQVDGFTAFKNHASHSEWKASSHYRDLSSADVVDLTAAAAPVPEEALVEISLVEFTPSEERIKEMLNESRSSRIKSSEGTGVSALDSSPLVSVPIGMEYTNEDARMVFAPFGAPKSSHKSSDDAVLAGLDCLLDLSQSLDLLSSLDVLNTYAGHCCNFSDVYTPPVAGPVSAAAAAAAASATEPNNDFESMYAEQAALTEEELYAHIPDEPMSSLWNTTNSRAATFTCYASLCAGGVTISDASALVQSSGVRLHRAAVSARLTGEASLKYRASYQHYANGYKENSAAAHAEKSGCKIVTPSISHNEKLEAKKPARRSSSDYLSSDDEGGALVDSDSECDLDAVAVAGSSAESTKSAALCSQASIDRVLNSPFLSHLSRRLTVIRGVLTTISHEDTGAFDNGGHSASLCGAMALDLLPLLVVMCRCEAYLDSLESSSFAVGGARSSASGRRSTRGRGTMAAPEKFVDMKARTFLTESQLHVLMNLTKWSLL